MTHWIFLRGLTRESGHWGDFVATFEAAIPHSQVITLDLPGNGTLHQQRSPTHVGDMVESCRTQLAALGLAPPYHLLAMSLGAMVAVHWADAYPEEVSAQVLINTSMRPFGTFYQRLQPANYVTLLQLMLPGTAPLQWESAILRMTSNQTHDGLLRHWLALRCARPVSRANALRQLLAAARYRAPPGLPKVATLLLASQADHLVNVICSTRLATHWQCPLRLHPSAGHDLPLDDAAWVLAQVQHWLGA
ncbi:MAG: hydrolase or acyltransferase-like protein [Comamonadaceae bacterium]|nr:MAG: hydrolase or acyltransferase-like protein [Comamonadaceae bacterium]